MKRNRPSNEKRPSNFGRWFETLTPEQRSLHGQRAARAEWGPKRAPLPKANDGPWVWPIDVNRYDRSPALTVIESDMLTRYAEAYRFYRYGRTMDFGPALDRLIRPLNDVFDYTGIKTEKRRYVLLFFLREMAERNRSFWGWTTEEWIDSIDARQTARQHIVAAAYLLCDFSDLHRLKSDHIVYNCLARKVFGHEYAKVIMDRVHAHLTLQEWLGHATPAATQHYAKITPTKLAKSYADAGYFARNLRAIEVLVDQELVRNGRAAREPWKFYDLGQHAASPIMPTASKYPS